MALRINTNVAALNAHKNMIKTDNSLSESLGRLSSGLRINKAADDASGMAIADSLRSQKLGLGQAIRNGSDGVNIVQTADAALEESINIVNTIKTKAIQAAQDGQTTDSRKAIQADITKLTDELDTIAKTTSFNNQKLLSGNFTNKKFQMGAYAGETIDISIASTEANKIGHVTTSNLTFGGEGMTELNVYSATQNKNYTLNEIELSYDNNAEHGVGAVADSINRLSDVLGISATATVETSTEAAIAGGTTDSDFAINGVNIGAITVEKNDADGALAAEINKKTSEHGVVASVDVSGILTLSSSDGRAIEVTQGTETTKVFGDTEKMSTFGTVELRQEGTGEILITDVNDASGGLAVSSEDGLIKVTGIAATTEISTLAEGSHLVGAELAAGTVIEGEFTTSGAVAAITTDDSKVAAGSTLATGSVLSSGTVLGGQVTVNAATVATTVVDSIVTSGSKLAGSSEIGSGSEFDGDVTDAFSGGTFTFSGGKTYVTDLTAIKATRTMTLTGDAKLGNGSVVEADSVLEKGSVLIDSVITTKGATTVEDDMVFKGAGSTIGAGSSLTTGSYVGMVVVNGSGTVSGDESMTLATGTVLGADTEVANGSSLGNTATTSEDEVVSDDTNMLLGVGSVIASGSTIAAGTTLTNDMVTEGGATYAKGTTLETDIILSGNSAALTKEMTLAGGSILETGSQLAVNKAAEAITVDSQVDDAQSYRLADIDVTTQEGAQVGIAVADAALKSLDKVRSDLGSVQNQLTSTIANISTTKVNVAAAESSIRDVDFAEESANFTKMQILAQAGSFAMSQANSSSQNVMSLLR
ncbi:MAG: flagellar protein FlaB [Desulfobacteraceae bacterium]|nr:flagellar protein FlaB [Desulfobacteraceae bacterium]